MDLITYALAKKYVKDTAVGLGAVKGAPATIKSITPIDGGNQILFEWTGTDGNKNTSALIVKDGGTPIITPDENNTDTVYKLVITNADGSNFITPNLIGKGSGGEGGGGNSPSLSINGTELSADDTLNFEEISESDIQSWFADDEET